MKKLIISALSLGLVLGFEMVDAQTETTGRETVYRATHNKTTELKHTKLKVQFDYEKSEMQGEEWLTASPYFYASDSIVLNAKSMLIHEVALDNGTKKPLKYDYKNDILNIKLDKLYKRNENYTIYIKYTARPNQSTQKGSEAITGAKGLYFINPQGKDENKPVQIWTQGETESSSVWFPTIDKPNQKTTQEIYMTVPDKYITLSNGELKSQTKESNGLRTDHWVMEKKHAPYLFFMGVGDYAVIKDKWRNISVDYYVEKEYEPYAKEIFGNTPEMLEFFSKLLRYDYPWNKYAQMTARDYVSGAMENTTAVLHSETAQQKPGDLIDGNRWEDVIAHELFHHWFGDLVTAESWANLSMNESFANYSEYLWNEYKYGKDLAGYTLKKNTDGYILDINNISKDLIRFDYHSREDMFDAVSYNKGGAVLHMLRNYLGDEAFFGGVSDYLKTNEYGTGEAHQLRLSLEKVSGKDLNWFFNQWFFGSGHPILKYSYTFEPVKKEVVVRVTQSQLENYFQFPLAMDIYENGMPVRRNVWVEAKANNEFRFPISKNPDLVNINADGVLLGEISDEKTPQQYLLQYKNSTDFLSRWNAVNHTDANNETSWQVYAVALEDGNFHIRQLALKKLDLSNAKQYKLVASAVEKLAKSDPKTIVQATAISALAKTKQQKYASIYENGIMAVSNSVKGVSLAAISELDPKRVVALADKLDLENVDENTIVTLMPTIIDNKIEKQMPAIASVVAFYPFIKLQNPEQGAIAEKGFNWIMTSDNLKATEGVTRTLKMMKQYTVQNPQLRSMILQILENGLEKKMQLLRTTPTASLNQQVEDLNKAIEGFK